MNYSCVVNSSQQMYFAVEIVRALQTGNVDNISVNVDAKWVITYRSNFIHVCKLNIETLFRFWFDVDSYVQFR